MILGIDVGSVSVGMVVMTTGKQVRRCFYEFHHGDIANTIERLLESIETDRITAVAATDQTTDLICADFRCDDRVAVICAARHFNEQVGAVLHVGGEKFGMLFFDEKGEYSGLKTNTSCAAGTGSFIEEQAEKLGVALTDYADRTWQVASPIASDRCTVFMERDINYYLSRGYTVPPENILSEFHVIPENHPLPGVCPRPAPKRSGRRRACTIGALLDFTCQPRLSAIPPARPGQRMLRPIFFSLTGPLQYRISSINDNYR